MAIALIVDDEKDICELIEMGLAGQGILCDMTHGVKQAIKKLKSNNYDFMICDIKLPDGDGLDLLAHVMKYYPNLPVCMITAHGSMEMAIRALRLGAFDFINKPFDLKQLRSVATQALKEVSKTAKKKKLANSGKHNGQICSGEQTLIGETESMREVRSLIQKVARSQAPVFIYGESGTGKEIVARCIHGTSARGQEPFIAVNCGAIPENLVESEFFGYKKGAFTGADQDKQGLFEVANGGTLFLDEIADLPLSMQVKLLRAIQERAVRPIGANEEQIVDVRIISATHHDLEKRVADKKFRQDLYYRLNVIGLALPPLRDRIDDIPLLTDYLLKRLANNVGYELATLTPAAMNKLQRYPYPGNVRELENILERALTFTESKSIDANDIILNELLLDKQISDVNGKKNSIDQPLAANLETQHSQDPLDLPDNLDNYMETLEKELLIKALNDSDQNKTKAAEKLGITFRAIRYKLKKFGID